MYILYVYEYYIDQPPQLHQWDDGQAFAKMRVLTTLLAYTPQLHSLQTLRVFVCVRFHQFVITMKALGESKKVQHREFLV